MPKHKRYYSEKRGFILVFLNVLMVLATIKIIAYWCFTQLNNGDSEQKQFNSTREAEISSAIFQSNVQSQAQYKWQTLADKGNNIDTLELQKQKIKLGEILFNDTLLSYDNSVSCASCHVLDKKYLGADGLKNATGINQQKGNRNTPTVFNSTFQRVQFWDGRAKSLQQQALGPILNPIEMGIPSIEYLVQRLAEQENYITQFAQAFPLKPEISAENITEAIASYEATLITTHSDYDKFVLGDKTALTRQQQKGMLLFAEIGCVYCHSGPNFSEASIWGESSPFRSFPTFSQSIYIDKYRLTDDKGMNQLQDDKPNGVWRIPSLRNVSYTAPYFHNGAVDTLEEAVKIMVTVQLGKKVIKQRNKNLSINQGQVVDEQDIAAIVSFLKAI